MKKTALALVAALVMICGAVSVSHSAMANFPPEFLEGIKKEPPVTQEDIDKFIPLWSEIMNDGRDNVSDAEAEAMFAKHGFSSIRGPFVLTKIANARMLSQVPAEQREMAKQVLTTQTGMPAGTIPTANEQALVDKNKAALDGVKFP